MKGPITLNTEQKCFMDAGSQGSVVAGLGCMSGYYSIRWVVSEIRVFLSSFLRIYSCEEYMTGLERWLSG